MQAKSAAQDGMSSRQGKSARRTYTVEMVRLFSVRGGSVRKGGEGIGFQPSEHRANTGFPRRVADAIDMAL